MTSSEAPKNPNETPFTVNKEGADGVGGFVLYGLRLEGGIFHDNKGNRYDPALMGCPDHPRQVVGSESLQVGDIR